MDDEMRTAPGTAPRTRRVLAVGIDGVRLDPVDAAFVYLGAADETAHLHGCGERYLASIEKADARLGRLLDAVRGRAGYALEDWTAIVVTDHGHVDEGGHGGHSTLERTAWIAARGPDIAPGVTPNRELRHVDVGVHTFTALGLEPDRHWTLDGRPFVTAAAGQQAGQQDGGSTREGDGADTSVVHEVELALAEALDVEA
jgi:arylsulfatase A-like enzyme